jgi:hypothetical protein
MSTFLDSEMGGTQIVLRDGQSSKIDETDEQFSNESSSIDEISESFERGKNAD